MKISVEATLSERMMFIGAMAMFVICLASCLLVLRWQRLAAESERTFRMPSVVIVGSAPTNLVVRP